MSLRRSHLLLAMVVLAPGCVLLSPTDPYAGMRSELDFASVASLRSVSAVHGPVTLAEAIRIALANNPQLAASRHDLEIAHAEHGIAFGAALPKIGLRGGYTHSLYDQRLFSAREPKDWSSAYSKDIFGADVVLTASLFAGGRHYSEIEATRLLEESARRSLARTREELVFQVSRVYFTILAQRKVVISLEFSHSTLEDHLQRIQQLIAAQKAARVDRLRVEVRVADLEEALARERSALAILGRTLANLLGVVEVQQDPVQVVGELTLAESWPPQGEGDPLSRALSNRADLQAARAALEAQARRVDAARAAHWPALLLQGSYGGRWAAGSSEPGTDRDVDVGSIGVVLDVPIFDGGGIAARVRRETARLAGAQERLRSFELQIRLDVETALLDVDTALERVRATRKGLAQAEESLRIEREKHALGKGTVTDVLDAQAASLALQTSHFRALADHSIARARLRLAVGEDQ